MNRTLSAICIIGAAACFSTAAQGQVTETSTIQNTYSYNVGGQTGSGSNNGGVAEVYRTVTGLSGISEMGLSLTGTLDNGSFFFLHNGVCVGQCSMTLTTDIAFTLTNTGTAPVDLRFDSQITPGHLANSFLNPNSNSQASFSFAVSQVPGLRQGIIYTADGLATAIPPAVTTSDGSVFNGFNVQNNTPLWSLADWSATNLSLNLATILPGATSQLFYRSTLQITTNQTDCPDPTLCESFQVAFGDPRNLGGVILNSALASFSNFLSPTAVNLQNPAVGAIFDPFRVSYRFVPQGSPLPPPPPTFGPRDYDVNYRSLQAGAVPEPSTWTLMLVGFGLVGGMLRRRRGRAVKPFPA